MHEAVSLNTYKLTEYSLNTIILPNYRTFNLLYILQSDFSIY